MIAACSFNRRISTKRGHKTADEDLVLDRVARIGNCPLFQRARSGERVVGRRDDDYGYSRAERVKLLLEFQSADAGHSYVGDEAAEGPRRIVRQERVFPIEGTTRQFEYPKEL
jgi:hypothetical protein